MSNLNGRSFAHGIFWNLLGMGVPLVVAVLAIPHLLSGYGSARFGFLTIIWALIGYFSVFDLGLGRALTKFVSERLGTSNEQDLSSIIPTGLWSIGVLGLISAVLLFASAPWIVSLLQVDADLQVEGLASIRMLALSIPLVTLSAGLIGLLESYGEFPAINVIRLAMGILNFAGPLALLPWSNSLIPATISLAAVRLITTYFYIKAVQRARPTNISPSKISSKKLKELIKFGGWISVSNLSSPLMAQLDKLLISTTVALTLLPLYAIPGDIINRLSFIPAALITVLFPTLSSNWSTGNHRIHRLFNQANFSMLSALIPIALTIYLFSQDALTLWLGTDFSRNATPLLQCLTCGYILNGVARIPHAVIQAGGRPDITAKIHLIELPTFVIALWLLLSNFGIFGAALAWTGRMALDLFLLTWSATNLAKDLRRSAWKYFAIVMATSIGLLNIPQNIPVYPRLVFCGVIIAFGFTYAFRTLLAMQQERSTMKSSTTTATHTHEGHSQI